MKDYTSVLNIMKQKLDNSAKKTYEKDTKLNNYLNNFSKYRSLSDFETLFRGLNISPLALKKGLK